MTDNLTLEDIEEAMPLAPHLHVLRGVHCPFCGLLIHPGETAYHALDPLPPWDTVCYHCGTSMMIETGWYDAQEAANIPPYGGGPREPDQ